MTLNCKWVANRYIKIMLVDTIYKVNAVIMLEKNTMLKSLCASATPLCGALSKGSGCPPLLENFSLFMATALIFRALSSSSESSVVDVTWDDVYAVLREECG